MCLHHKYLVPRVKQTSLSPVWPTPHVIWFFFSAPSPLPPLSSGLTSRVAPLSILL